LRCPVDLTESQRLVRDGVREVCAEFDDAYWRRNDREKRYPTEFVDLLGENGWLGVLLPEEYGGAGMGTPETVVMMEEIAASGGGFATAQAVHGGVYNSVPIVNHGSEELKEELLPSVAAGETSIQAFGLTEPNAGSDSTSIQTVAERDGDEYVIDGQKIWTSRLDHSDYLLLVARTTPKEDVEKKTRGISTFLVDLADAKRQDAIEAERIPKTASTAVHAFEVWFDGLRVPAGNLVGEEGEGFYQVLDGLNEERLVIAAECIGLGEVALERGVEYAAEREVFDRPIGKNQAVQHPLAESYMHLQAAKELTYAAATRAGTEDTTTTGTLANTAKYLAAEACFEAADAAVQAHGGFGVAREYDVERFFREARLTRLVPITQQLALNYVAENELRLPRSY
jgi:acyl-CoA dehydrogenase